MNKKLTLVLLSFILAGSGLSARPTLQDVRNTITIRNACKVAGGIAGFGLLYNKHLPSLPCFTIPLPPISFALNKLNPFVIDKYIRGTKFTRRLHILPTVGAFSGAYVGAKVGEMIHDTIANKYQTYKTNKEAAARQS